MKEYFVKYYDKEPYDLSGAQTAYIDNYVWGTKYTPGAYAKLIFVKDIGFVLEMTAEERNPRAIYTDYNDPVYTDSCLEFFAAFDNTSNKYINMEMNSKGTLLSCVGSGRNNRIPIFDLTGCRIFPINATVKENTWKVKALIPLEMLQSIYNMDTSVFVPGYEFRGNFYKCGDDTEIPHYGSWSPVITERPDFHRPEYFGILTIKR